MSSSHAHLQVKAAKNILLSLQSQDYGLLGELVRQTEKVVDAYTLLDNMDVSSVRAIQTNTLPFPTVSGTCQLIPEPCISESYLRWKEAKAILPLDTV